MITKYYAAVLSTVLFLPANTMGQDTVVDHDSTLKKSMDYVLTLQDGCVRTDGYKCVDESAVAALGSVALPGNYLKAWSVCYDNFLKIEDLTEDQKQLHHYNVRITEDKERYVVEFLGLLLPYIDQGDPASIITAVFGRSMKYWVQKDTFQISKRLFYK